MESLSSLSLTCGNEEEEKLSDLTDNMMYLQPYLSQNLQSWEKFVSFCGLVPFLPLFGLGEKGGNLFGLDPEPSHPPKSFPQVMKPPLPALGGRGEEVG